MSGRWVRAAARGMLGALALAGACAAYAAGPAPAGAASRAARGASRAPARRARIELRVTFGPWESSGSFRLETSTGRVDQGTARDLGGFSAAGGSVRRVLEGEKGTLVLRLQGAPRPGQPPVFGRWTLASGTGAYAGIAASGTFTALSNGDRRGGSPYELQFLVGIVEYER